MMDVGLTKIRHEKATQTYLVKFTIDWAMA